MANKLNLIGEKYNLLTVIKEADPYISPGGSKKRRWLCQCECGNTKEVNQGELRSNKTKSCGCLAKERIIAFNKEQKHNLVGNKYSLLTVIKELPTRNGHSYWMCKCECGNEKAIAGRHLVDGTTQSCGCYKKKVAKEVGKKNILKAHKQITEHGLSEHPFYERWIAMNNRCGNPNSSSYKYYGAKGVYVCERWHRDNPDGCQNFIDDMYPSYLEALETIDKPQLDKDIKAIPGQAKCYSPETCCWVDPQTNNIQQEQVKLTPELVSELRNLSSTYSYKELSLMFNVSYNSVYLAINGYSWKKITPLETTRERVAQSSPRMSEAA